PGPGKNGRNARERDVAILPVARLLRHVFIFGEEPLPTCMESVSFENGPALRAGRTGARGGFVSDATRGPVGAGDPAEHGQRGPAMRRDRGRAPLDRPSWLPTRRPRAAPRRPRLLARSSACPSREPS